MNLHEDFSHHHHAEGSSDRGFGFVFTVVFVIVALLPLRHGNGVRLWALAVSALFLVLALVAPSVLHVPNKLWMRLALLLSKIMNPIVIGLLFFLVITPFGWVIRRLGKDPLRLRLDASTPSYWIERQPPGPAPQSMANQF